MYRSVVQRSESSRESAQATVQRLTKERSICRPGYLLFIGILILFVVPCRFVYLSPEVLSTTDMGDLKLAILVLFLVVMVILALLYTVMEANPGFVYTPPFPYNAHRCPECHVMVDEYDHHCGVLGTCIGRGNMKYFITFLFFGATGSAISTVLGFNFLYQVVQLGSIPAAFQRLNYEQFFWFLVSVFWSVHRIIGLASTITTLYSTIGCYGMFFIYLFKAARGRYSVKRRRQDLDYSFFDVFHDFFSPNFDLSPPEEERIPLV